MIEPEAVVVEVDYYIAYLDSKERRIFRYNVESEKINKPFRDRKRYLQLRLMDLLDCRKPQKSYELIPAESSIWGKVKRGPQTTYDHILGGARQNKVIWDPPKTDENQGTILPFTESEIKIMLRRKKA